MIETIAHIRGSDGKVQTVEEHLLQVKQLAESYGEKLGLKHVSGLCGLLHDLGKLTVEFREYILEAVQNPDNPPRRGSVDHSSAGGMLLFDSFHDPKVNDRYKVILAEIAGNAIISHHSYLHDFLNHDLTSPYLKRVKEKKPTLTEYEYTKELFFERVMTSSDFDLYVEAAALELKNFCEKPTSMHIEQSLMFVAKVVFSALVDADRTNTRQFEEAGTAQSHTQTPSSLELFTVYYERLIRKVEELKGLPDSQSSINLLRTRMSEKCDEFAEKPSDIYTLSIPTGGGKTLASLRYALKHALKTNKKRIIYILPFTTIIEQNAEEVRKILKDDEHILEHHSNVGTEQHDEMSDGLSTPSEKLKLAKDNWDTPIVFTTMVQFLNTFYEGSSRSIRRLHNLSDAVIIFDEVQKVPVRCVSLFNQAVNFLKEYGDSSIVLCTATQPALQYVEKNIDIQPGSEMIEDLDEVQAAFKRVDVVDFATDQELTNEKLLAFIQDRLRSEQNALVILNTKSVVKDLYKKCVAAGWDVPVYHLSTSMCPAHRKNILRKVRGLLENQKPVVCISTQLIEAGVDVDFQCVIRSLAGLDSIAQAAGRCNRHGTFERKKVFIIDHQEENLSRLKEIKVGKTITKRILKDMSNDPDAYKGDLLSKEAMEKYFKEFYTELEFDLDYPVPSLGSNLLSLLHAKRKENSLFHSFRSKHGEHPPLFLMNSYRTAADHFEAIGDLSTSVIVPYEGGKEIIADLNGDRSISILSEVLKKAQQYSINLYKHEVDRLASEGGIATCLDGRVIILKEWAYSLEFGLDLNQDSNSEFLGF